MSEKKDPKPCPYNRKVSECGYPDKFHALRCSGYGYQNCVSYRFLKEYEEEKKDGKQDN